MVMFGLSSNQQSRLLDGARALLGPSPRITGAFVGRGHYRMSVAAVPWLMILALAAVGLRWALGDGSLLLRLVAGGLAGMSAARCYEEIRPGRAVAVSDEGFAVLACNPWTMRPNHVVTGLTPGDPTTLVQQSPDRRIQLGRETITFDRVERERLLVSRGIRPFRRAGLGPLNKQSAAWLLALTVVVLAYLFGRGNFLLAGVLLGVSLTGLAVGSLGYWAGALLHDRSESPVNRLLCWTNAVTWLIPPLGILNASYVLGLLKDQPSKRRSFGLLTCGCLLLALANAALGTWISVTAQRQKAASRTSAPVLEDRDRGVLAAARPSTQPQQDRFAAAIPPSTTTTTAPCVPPEPPPNPPVGPAPDGTNGTTRIAPSDQSRPPAATPPTKITLVGCHVYLLRRGTYSYDPGNARISISYHYGNTISVDIYGDEDSHVEFAPPIGKDLARGVYTSIPEWGARNASIGGFSFSSEGSGCKSQSTFTIYELTVVDNLVTRLLATFQQLCIEIESQTYGIVDFHLRP